jgi:hypothetical protein
MKTRARAGQVLAQINTAADFAVQHVILYSVGGFASSAVIRRGRTCSTSSNSSR